MKSREEEDVRHLVSQVLVWMEGALVFSFGLGRHRVALEGHEEDIVKPVLFKQAFNRQVWCTIEFSIRFLRFSSLFLVTLHVEIIGFRFLFVGFGALLAFRLDLEVLLPNSRFSVLWWLDCSLDES